MLASHDPMENPAVASRTATADRLVVFVPGWKAKLTVPEAVTRTADGTAVEATAWMTPFWIGVAMTVNVLPLRVPRSRVSRVDGRLLRVALLWAAVTTAPVAPEREAAVA